MCLDYAFPIGTSIKLISYGVKGCFLREVRKEDKHKDLSLSTSTLNITKEKMQVFRVMKYYEGRYFSLYNNNGTNIYGLKIGDKSISIECKILTNLETPYTGLYCYNSGYHSFPFKEDALQYMDYIHKSFDVPLKVVKALAFDIHTIGTQYIKEKHRWVIVSKSIQLSTDETVETEDVS